MALIRKEITTHKFEKTNLVTTAKGCDEYTCTECGMKVISKDLVHYMSAKHTADQLAHCPKHKTEENGVIEITNCTASGRQFANLTPGSQHAIIPTPAGENNRNGYWVMGVGEPVKVLFPECKLISNKTNTNQEPKAPQTESKMEKDLDKTTIENVVIKPGTTLVEKSEKEGVADVKLTVQRITKKSVFVLEEGAEEPKMVVTALFASKMQKGQYVDIVTPADEPKAPKAPKAPKEEKVRTLSLTVQIHYFYELGLSVEQVAEKLPDVKVSHIRNSFNDAKTNQEKAKKSVAVYLAHYPDAEVPTGRPADADKKPEPAPKPEPEATAPAEEKAPEVAPVEKKAKGGKKKAEKAEEAPAEKVGEEVAAPTIIPEEEEGF